MRNVVVYRRKYLPLSETFIYEQLIGHTEVRTMVLTRSRPINRSQFPFEPIYVRKSFDGLPAWLKQKDVKCLHARFGPAGLELLPIARKAELPLLTSFHGVDISKRVKANPGYKRRLQHLFRHGDAFTVVSDHMKRRLIRLGCPEHKITLIRSGIDLNKFPFLPIPEVEDGRYRFLSVGRLVEKKGMDTLIRAFRRVRRAYPGATLTIVGKGEQRKKLERLIRLYDLSEAVRLKGALLHRDVQKEMAECHVFVIACKTARDGNQEGIPNVLMEAMATGRPVVSTRHAGIPELVEHGKSGYLVPERSYDKLADAMMRMIAERDKWGQMAREAREKVEQHHDVRNQRKKLETLYLQLIGRT